MTSGMRIGSNQPVDRPPNETSNAPDSANETAVNHESPDKTMIKRKRESDFGETVDILAGKEEKIIIVHKELLAETREFFAAMFHSTAAWRESLEHTIKLADWNPGTVQMLVHWVYKDCLPLRRSESDTFDFDAYCDLYRFAHLIHSAQLQNLAVTHIAFELNFSRFFGVLSSCINNLVENIENHLRLCDVLTDTYWASDIDVDEDWRGLNPSIAEHWLYRHQRNRHLFCNSYKMAIGSLTDMARWCSWYHVHETPDLDAAICKWPQEVVDYYNANQEKYNAAMRTRAT